MLKFVYTLFVGLLLVAFVGLGVDAFYPGPESLEYPNRLEKYEVSPVRCADGSTQQLTDEEQAEYDKAKEEYDTQYEAFNEARKTYSRNVSMLVIAIAIVVLVVSIATSSKIAAISDGLILGGVFTLTYGIIRGFDADDAIFRFLVVTVGLIVAFALGYAKFIRPETTSLEHH